MFQIWTRLWLMTALPRDHHQKLQNPPIQGISAATANDSADCIRCGGIFSGNHSNDQNNANSCPSPPYAPDTKMSPRNSHRAVALEPRLRQLTQPPPIRSQSAPNKYSHMNISKTTLIKGAFWTIGSFGIAQFLRLAANVVLARLLAPELFGVMQIFYSLRTGADLISDVGIGQNIIYNKNADDPDFYNTAWTLQLVRGILLWLVCCAAAIPFARFYNSPTLSLVMPVSGFYFVLSGISSNSRFRLQKRMKYNTLTVFETLVGIIASGAQVVLAYISPTIWALVFGALAGTTFATIGSHFLIPDVRHRLFISRRYAREIRSFGKWIFVSSIIFFLSTNFDRLYLAKLIPLGVLGVYGMARALSDLSSTLVARLGNSVIFPFVAAHSQMPRVDLHTQLAPIRMKFLLLAGFGFSIYVSVADLAIGILSHQRSHAASWMRPILIIGAWFSIMSNINESTLLGLGMPSYGAAANSAKFAFLLIGLTLSVLRYGVLGGVTVVAFADLFRYVPILVGQIRERFSFFRQDVVATFMVFGLVCFWEWSRWALGFGTSFDNLPLDAAR